MIRIFSLPRSLSLLPSHSSSVSLFTLLTSLLIALPISLLLPSCTTDFDPKLDDTPIPVINALAERDSLLVAMVSRSWLFNTLNDPAKATLPDANVQYRVDGGQWLPMTFNEETARYECDHRCMAGESVEIKADTRFGEAEGSANVPTAVPIDKVEYTVETRIDQNSFSMGYNGEISHPLEMTLRFKVTFTDPAGENYYLVAGSGYVDDPIIGENESAMDGVLNKYHYCSFFTDRTISLQTYTLSLFESFYLWPTGDGGYGRPWSTKSTIKLINLSKDYYLYILSLFKKYTGFQGILEDFGVAEPRSVFSNVSTGAGIIASDAVSLYELDVLPIFEKELEKMGSHLVYPDWDY